MKMKKMMDDILKYVLLLIIFWIISYILINHTGNGKLNKCIRGFAYLGIFFHELSHYIIAKLVHAKVSSFKMGKDNDKMYGSIRIEENINFLQSLLIGIAPFLISTYLLTLVLQYLYSPFCDFYIAIFFLSLSLSLVLGSVPSFQDWKVVTFSIRQNPAFTIYQVCLIVVIFYIKQIIFSEGQIIFGFEPLNSIIIIGGIYYLIRYSVKGIIIFFKYLHRIYHFNRLYKSHTKSQNKYSKNFGTEIISASLDYIPLDINFVRYMPTIKESSEIQESHESEIDNSHISYNTKKNLEADSWLTDHFVVICISMFSLSLYVLIVIAVIIESVVLLVLLITLYILYIIVLPMADWDLSINYHYKREALIIVLKVLIIVPVLIRRIGIMRDRRHWNKWYLEKYGVKPPPPAQW